MVVLQEALCTEVCVMHEFATQSAYAAALAACANGAQS